MTPKQKIEKLKMFQDNPQLALHQELVELNETLEKIAQKEMPEHPPMPPMPEMPKEMAVEIKGAEVVTIKGQDGKDSIVPGPRGEKGEKGDRGDSIVGPKGERGEDGQSIKGDTGPVGPAGKDGSPDTAEQVRDKLETLHGKERLDISAIDGLEERIKAIPETTSRPIFGGGGGRSNVQYVDLSVSLDGSTKTFNLPTHFGIIAVFGSSAPFVFRPTVDWIESGRNIVFDAAVDATIALATGQSLIVLIKRTQ